MEEGSMRMIESNGWGGYFVNILMWFDVWWGNDYDLVGRIYVCGIWVSD